jgi:signal transduction histidine kinase
MAELHGGQLKIESQEGRGTTVHLTLPYDRMVPDAKPSL